MLRVEILPWDSDAAENYVRLRSACEKEGLPLGTMDMLIAAHCIAAGAVLITNDQAFYLPVLYNATLLGAIGSLSGFMIAGACLF